VPLHVVVLQHPEGLGGEVLAHDLLRVEHVAQLVAGQAVKVGVVGVELGAEQRATLIQQAIERTGMLLGDEPAAAVPFRARL
jgi:hypothetical protein